MQEIVSKAVEELNVSEKMDLVAFSSTSYYPLLRKIMEQAIIMARDRAVLVDPANEAAQRARMTEARAMSIFYTTVCDQIANSVAEHLGYVKQKAAEEAANDREFIESVILNQQFTK